MIVNSLCSDCGCEYAIPYIHMCEKMYNPDHNQCDDACNPKEVKYVPRWHRYFELIYRCISCESLNTEKNG